MGSIPRPHSFFAVLLAAAAVRADAAAEDGGIAQRASVQARKAEPPAGSAAGRAAEAGAPTEIVLLGTGTPRPFADRQGPSLAIISNGKAYIVDAGSGLTRQANTAFANGVQALRVEGLDVAFITHLHSDHTLGLPDLILTPWVFGRALPLELYGPKGTKEMADDILKAYQQDERVRLEGLERANHTGWRVNAHEIRPGLVYEDKNVRVTAFLVEHGDWPEAYGYRFDTADNKSIVISGDTRPSDAVAKACNGCDVLIHEVYSGQGGSPLKRPEDLMKYMAAYHTSARDLGALATKAGAKTLVVTHFLPVGSSNQTEMVESIKKTFSKSVVVARDLDVIVP